MTADQFTTTRWTVVLSAGRQATAESGQAMEELCRTYWYPLYAYVRRKGFGHEDAEEHVQAFFAYFIEKNFLDSVNSEKGKFRAFLLAAMKNFLGHQRESASRVKRGGQATLLSLDWQSAEQRYRIEPADCLTPEKLYERAWVVTLLEHVIARLGDECAAEGKAALFEQLKPSLMATSASIDYAQAAAALKTTETAMRVAVHRLRKRYRELLRDEIAQTLSNPSQIEDEIRALFEAFEN
ncbi:MAG TPA: sigma-70 family RNA polymerase sigma factor [Planctomycetota bacterium]|nr:sigma-70 family RNA polymerase sigma factor [Planctomycetota bacterium]